MTTAAPSLTYDRLQKNIYDQLKAIDWTFASAYTRGSTHGVHPYPAKFIPQIPRTLISALHPKDGTAVLDPFCGSGTTLVEAALAGVPSVGVDLHPLACLISKVKITPLTRDLRHAAEDALQRTATVDSTPPKIPGLDHWFRPDIQRALTKILRSIDAEQDQHTRDALYVAFSSIVVRVSNQESDTRYAAIEKDVTPEDVSSAFLEAALGLESALTSTWGGLFNQRVVTQVINKDILAVRPEEIGLPISLVVTSPPYPNAYEYWLYHKYRMYWLGMDPISVREKEIGARPHFFKRNPHTPEDFERQMGGVLALISQILTPGGHACFQVGSSRIRGKVIDNAEMIRRAAARHGFEQMVSVTRGIPSSKKGFNLSHARIQEEEVLVFRLATK